MRLLTAEGILPGAGSPAVGEPCVAPSGLEAGGWTRAASLRGHDAIACWGLPDGRLGLFLGDVPGGDPGEPARLARVAALLKGLAHVRADPAWMLASANTHLYRGGATPGLVTAFVGGLASEGTLAWASAGQGPVYVRTGARGSFAALRAGWPPLGFEREVSTHQAASVVLARGGRVAVLSEGLLDAVNDAGQPLGARRAKTMLDNTAGVPLDRTLEIVHDVVGAWQGGEAPDGQAILIAGRLE